MNQTLDGEDLCRFKKVSKRISTNYKITYCMKLVFKRKIDVVENTIIASAAKLN